MILSCLPVSLFGELNSGKMPLGDWLKFAKTCGFDAADISMFDDDYVTKRMIEEFILDEQDHFNWVKGHLHLIETLGMENYMIEMLGE